jgi:hypothetical protein
MTAGSSPSMTHADVAPSRKGSTSGRGAGRGRPPDIAPKPVSIAEGYDCDGCGRSDSPRRSRRTSKIRTMTRSPTDSPAVGNKSDHAVTWPAADFVEAPRQECGQADSPALATALAMAGRPQKKPCSTWRGVGWMGPSQRCFTSRLADNAAVVLRRAGRLYDPTV